MLRLWSHGVSSATLTTTWSSTASRMEMIACGFPPAIFRPQMFGIVASRLARGPDIG